MTAGEGVTRDSGCGVSMRSSNSDVHHRGKTSVRKAFFSFGKNKKGGINYILTIKNRYANNYLV